ncbi:MAG: Ig-like domain-containing protein [Nanoarchaeota archaeon]|nr:Ig-like domain-containing protein [Nanoarchaeota archaeon]
MKTKEAREQLEQQLRAIALEKQKTLDSLNVVAEPKKRKRVYDLLQMQNEQQKILAGELQRTQEKEQRAAVQQNSRNHQNQKIKVAVGIGFTIMMLLLIAAFFQYQFSFFESSSFQWSSSITGLSVGEIPTVQVRDKDNKEVGKHNVQLREDGKYNLEVHIPDEIVGTSIAQAGEEAREITIKMHDAEILQENIVTKADYYIGTPPVNSRLRTKVISVEGVGNVNATIRLPKLGPVNTIFRCDDFDQIDFECVEWTATNIPFQDTGTEIVFTVDHFSAYVAGEIVAIDAIHLDANYNFISNIFDDINAVDDIWSEPIAEGEFVRVTYETNLTDGRVIDIFVRGNTMDAYVEVYEAGTNNLVGSSTLILSPDWKYITVGGLSRPMDVFDLRITSTDPQAQVEFDYIHDNAITPTQADGLIVYQNSNTNIMSTRTWNQSNNFSTVFNTLSIGAVDAAHIRLIGTYKRDEMLLGTSDGASDVNIQIFNTTNGNWTPLVEVSIESTAGSTARRGFDVAYEDLSGDGLIMYENNSVATAYDPYVQYRIWNGSRFSAQNNITTEDQTGNLFAGRFGGWVKLFPRPRSDQIMALLQNASISLFAIPWDGTQFDRANSLILGNNSAADTSQFTSFAWEKSGDGMAYYTDTALAATILRPYSATTGWGDQIIINQGTLLTITSCGDPNSDFIGSISQDSGADVNVTMWNGDALLSGGSNPLQDGAAEPQTSSSINVACTWVNDTSAMFGYVSSNALNFSYFFFHKPSTWSLASTASISTAPQSPNFASDDIGMLKFIKHPTKEEVMVITNDILADLRAIRWTGGNTFASVAESPLSTGLDATGLEEASFEWFHYDPFPNVTTLVPVLNSEFNVNDLIDVGGNVTDNLHLPLSYMLINITYPNGSNFTYVASNTTGAGTKFNFTFSDDVSGVFTVTFLGNDSRNSLNWTERTNFTIAAGAAEERSKDLISADIFNLSSGSSSQGGGFVVSSTSGKITNGTSLTYAAFDPTGLSRLNLSRIVNINISLIANGSHGNYVNVTFGWMLAKSNGSTMLNTTLYNSTLNQTRWNYSFNTNILPDGIYNISVYVQNVSTDAPFSSDIVVNYSRGFDIAIDRTAPNVTTFGMSNLTNGSNVTGGVIFFNVSINDSTTFAKFASIGLTNNFRNDTGFNVTLLRNFSGFHTALILSTMTDGFYTVRVYANDTLDNVNNSVANLSFTLDRTPPNVTFFTMNTSNDGSVAIGTVIQFNASLNDSTLSVETVRFGFRSSANGTEFNVTALKVDYIWNVTLQTSTMGASFYTVFVYGNDTLGNLNNTVGNLTFTLTSGTNTLPTAPLTFIPINDSSTTNRTPIFMWGNSTDADGNVISYHLQVDDNKFFNNPEINISAIEDLSRGSPEGNTTWYSTIELAVDTRYYWRVRANDSIGFGPWSDGDTGPTNGMNLSNFTVSSLLSITMFTSGVEFGSVVPGTEVNTSDKVPAPFRAENTGNIDTNVSLNASAIFVTVPINRSAYQFKIRENESNAFSLALSAMGWTNMSNSTTAAHVVNLTWRDARNDFLTDINLTIPSDEPPGFKTSTITFTVVRNE